MGTYVARLASTFFRVFSVFRGSNSSPDWVAGDAAPGPSVAMAYRIWMRTSLVHVIVSILTQFVTFS
jgi:hypothetical protein